MAHHNGDTGYFRPFPPITPILVEQISGKIWHNCGFNDKSVKTSKIVHLDLLNKIGYGPIALLFNMAAIFKMAPKDNTNF